MSFGSLTLLCRCMQRVIKGAGKRQSRHSHVADIHTVPTRPVSIPMQHRSPQNRNDQSAGLSYRNERNYNSGLVALWVLLIAGKPDHYLVCLLFLGNRNCLRIWLLMLTQMLGRFGCACNTHTHTRRDKTIGIEGYNADVYIYTTAV